MLCVACSRPHKRPEPAAASAAAKAGSSAKAISAAKASAPAKAGAATKVGDAHAAGLALRVEERIGKPGDPLSATLYRYKGSATHGRLWVARVLPDKARLHLLPASRPRPLAAILKGHEPSGDYVAVNGGFYDKERPMGLVVAAHKPIAPMRKGGGSGVFFVQAGHPAIVHRDAYKAERPLFALQSVDRLVDDGHVLVRARPGLRRDARSAVVIDHQGAVLLAVAFDAQAAFPLSRDVIRMSAGSTTSGPTLLEFARVLVGALRAESALNLDGGSSTSMRIRIGKAKLDVIARHATINALVASPR